MSAKMPSIKAPHNWSKYGEIYMDSNNFYVYVCEKCLKSAQCFELSFKTFDAQSFCAHVTNVHRKRATAQNDDNFSERRTSIKSQDDPEESLAKKARSEIIDLDSDADDNNNTSTMPSSGNETPIKTELKIEDDEVEDHMIFQEIGLMVEAVYNEDRVFEPMRNPEETIELSDEEDNSFQCVESETPDMPSTECTKLAFISTCPICQEAFVTTTEFYEHLRSQKHYAPKMCPFQCKDCGRRTASVEAMNQHQLRFHSSESESGTVACRICRKVVSNYHIKQHLAAHSTVRRDYKCAVCARAFRHKLNLEHHLRTTHPWLVSDQELDGKSANAANYSQRKG